MLDNIKESIHKPNEVLRLGCPLTWNPAFFYPNFENCIRQSFPEVQLELSTGGLPELMEALNNKEIDLILSHEFYPPLRDRYQIMHLTDSGCGILYSASYSTGKETSINEFKNQPFIVYENDSESRVVSLLNLICADYGYRPSIRKSDQYASALLELACGKGVMFFTEWDSAVTNTAYRYMKADYSIPVNLIWRSGETKPLVSRFTEEIGRYFKDIPGKL